MGFGEGKEKLRKGLWSPDEDEKLLQCIERNGHRCWTNVAALAGLQRSGKSCRLRWMNYLRPGLKRCAFSPHEQKLIIYLHACLGNRWSLIATQLRGRTDNEIKNFWNCYLKKKIKINPSSSNVNNMVNIEEDLGVPQVEIKNVDQGGGVITSSNSFSSSPSSSSSSVWQEIKEDHEKGGQFIDIDILGTNPPFAGTHLLNYDEVVRELELYELNNTNSHIMNMPNLISPTHTPDTYSTTNTTHNCTPTSTNLSSTPTSTIMTNSNSHIMNMTNLTSPTHRPHTNYTAPSSIPNSTTTTPIPNSTTTTTTTTPSLTKIKSHINYMPNLTNPTHTSHSNTIPLATSTTSTNNISAHPSNNTTGTFNMQNISPELLNIASFLFNE